MSQKQFKLKIQAPSNIAFVKYWGKFGRQYPMNPSLSMTLNNCFTEMEVVYSFDQLQKGLVDFEFEGKKNKKFEERIQKYLNSIEDIFPEIADLSFSISSKNTFPHSAGIASSASAMSALAGALGKISSHYYDKDIDFKQISQLARLASGSACRSVFPHYAIWGENKSSSGSNEYAKEFKDFHKDFSVMHDAILIVSNEEKSVSSSAGHELMQNHFFKDARINQAHDNLNRIINAMQAGDFIEFGEILENEALTLHALMMSSYPSFILLNANSILLIENIKRLRKESKLPMYFTIDAGPNIHLIYPDFCKDAVVKLIEDELLESCHHVIYDQIGQGLRFAND